MNLGFFFDVESNFGFFFWNVEGNFGIGVLLFLLKMKVILESGFCYFLGMLKVTLDSFFSKI